MKQGKNRVKAKKKNIWWSWNRTSLRLNFKEMFYNRQFRVKDLIHTDLFESRIEQFEPQIEDWTVELNHIKKLYALIINVNQSFTRYRKKWTKNYIFPFLYSGMGNIESILLNISENLFKFTNHVRTVCLVACAISSIQKLSFIKEKKAKPQQKSRHRHVFLWHQLCLLNFSISYLP